jgi:uncharacterized protein (DUF1778 family)
MTPQLAARVVINAASTTNGATATGIIDRMLPEGSLADWVTVDVVATTADVVSNKPTVLKLQQSDDTVASNFADITGLIGGTSFTIPNAVTAATAVILNHYKFNVNAAPLKRYLRAVYSPQTTQSVTVVANLGRARGAPITAAKANTLVLAEV